MGFYQKMAADRLAKKANAAEGERPKYKLLSADLLKQTDREHAAAVASFVATGEEAYKLAGQEGFRYVDLDLRRRIGVVEYKGVEIALLFNRQITELEPGPADPVPQRALKNPDNAWLVVDLLDTDDVEKKKGQTNRVHALMGQVNRLQMLWEEEQLQRKHIGEQLEKITPELQQLGKLRERIALMELEKKTTDAEIDNLRNEVRKLKDLRLRDKLELVRQIFPVFNTVWLAGLHRVSDQLYGMLKKQVTDALGGIGVKFIEPELGEPFNPEMHHAIHAIARPAGSRDIGAVLQVNKVGWKLGGAVIEAADVFVGVEEEKSEQEEAKSNGEEQPANESTATVGGDADKTATPRHDGGVDSGKVADDSGQVG